MEFNEFKSNYLIALNENRITQLDFYFADFLLENQSQLECNLLFSLLVWLSWKNRQGNICVNLNDFSSKTLFPESKKEDELTQKIWNLLGFPDLKKCLRALKMANFVGEEGNFPLILHKNRLYFQRFWQFENQIADYFLQKSANFYTFNDEQILRIKMLISMYFKNEDESEKKEDRQKLAALLALYRQILVISGGPGTGKTTTITKLLAIYLIFFDEQSPKIALAAPTGKAAARLSESIRKMLNEMNLPENIQHKLSHEAITLHRLIGIKINGKKPEFNKNNLLPLDLLIIDEASMLDISMMKQIIDALPEYCRLILLGDHDQLASVESGAILSELCSFSEFGYDKTQIDFLNLFTKTSFIESKGMNSLSNSLILLNKSYRFDKNSGIGLLANAVNQQNIFSVTNILQSSYLDLSFFPFFSKEDYDDKLNLLIEKYTVFFKNLNQFSPEKLLSLLNEFQLICALRKGKFGVKTLNDFIENGLFEKGLIQFFGEKKLFSGKPIMIRENNYDLNLFNGDIGLILYEPCEKQFFAYFRLSNGEIKSVPINQLPNYETAFAMTVHQSQGSEFNEVFFILPDGYSSILTKELLYTGITRAKSHLYLLAEPENLKRTVLFSVERTSGLKEKLKFVNN